MANISITGANGFIGKHLVNHLLDKNHDVIKINRETLINGRKVKDLRCINDWTKLFDKTDVVIHLAAFVHFPNKNKKKIVI